MSRNIYASKEELELCKRLLAESDRLLEGKFMERSSYQAVTLAFAAKSTKIYRGALLSAERGLGEPALMLIRAIFEDMVNMAYIAQDQYARAELYVNYTLVEKKKWLDNIEELNPGDPENEQRRKTWLPEYERVKDNYKDKRHWSGSNLKERVIAVDPKLTGTYLLLYPYASSFLHGGPLALESFVHIESDESLVPSHRPSDSDASSALAIGFGVFSRCLKLFALAWKLDCSRLHALSAEGDRLFIPSK